MMSSAIAAPRSLMSNLGVKYRAPIPAERLALVRLLVGGFCICYFAGRFKTNAAAARLDASGFRPIGVVSLLSEPLAQSVSVGILCATLAGSVLFTLGYRYKVVAPLLAVLLLWVTTYRSSWGMIFHSENLLFWHVAILSLAPAANALSLDSQIAKRRGGGTEAQISGWSMRLIMLAATLAYFLAGVAKLRGTGLFWASGEVLRNHVAFNALRKSELGGSYSELTVWLLHHAWLFVPFAWGTLLLELSGPLALVNRRLAWAWVIGMYIFHWSIQLVMEIPFWYPLSGVAFVAFFPLEKPLVALKNARKRWRRESIAESPVHEPR